MDVGLRNPLRSGDTLALCRRPGGKAEEWTVTGLMGTGGSTLCYSAKNGMKTGRLKEFYPEDRFSLARTSKGQLYVCRKSDRTEFESLRESFCGAYALLEQTKADSPEVSVLNNFLPPYELLWGMPGSGLLGTVYVWTPDDKQGILFSDYLHQINETPETEPEQSLYNILEALLTATDCLQILHRAALLHLDLKPSNFMLLWDGAGRVRPGSISLFDINTLYTPGNPERSLGGTEGYCAPEVYGGTADHRSDLYSLGATLLKALQPKIIYHQELYSMLDQLASDAPLIRCSETNSNVFLRYTLGKILRKTLAYYQQDRYSCCEELMEDLKKARTLLVPSVLGPELGDGRQLAVLAPKHNRSARAVLQDLLFRYPLEEKMVPQGQIRNVLVLGAGTYGQTFLDVCLQAAQALENPLRIIAASRDPELDREIYLQLRPGLPRFVDCGNGETPEECYGQLRFTGFSGSFGEGRDKEILRELLRRIPRPIHRIFVALGDDDRNREVARQAVRATNLRREPCRVHYAVHGSNHDDDWVLPVQMDAPLETGAIHPDLMRMAFNAHVSWMDTPNPDMHLAWEQFQKKYNLEASLAYALSIKGKLHSVGIWETDPISAARRFQEILKDEEQVQRLAAWEHRRWVMEKVTSGWQPPEDTQEAGLWGLARGSYVNKLKKRHPCLVPSRPGMPLAFFTPEQWEMPCPEEETMDPLDKVSLTLHRTALQMGAEARRRLALDRGDVNALESLVMGSPGEEAFRHYRLCLEEMLQGCTAAARQLSGREKALREAISELTPAVTMEALPRLQQLHRITFPAVESCFCRDYKIHDLQLIRRLPHILTFDHNRTVAVICTEKGSLLAHGASPMALQSREVIFLILPDQQKNWAERITALLEFLGQRQRVSVMALLTGEPDEGMLETLNQLQRQKRLAGFRFLKNQEQLIRMALEEKWLLAVDSLTGDCPGTHLGRMLQTVIPSVRYDWNWEAFTGSSGAEFWITNFQLPLQRGWTEETLLPWKTDPLVLPKCWKSLQTALQELEILLEKLPICPRGAVRTWSALFPEHRRTQPQVLLELLQQWDLAEEGSRLEPGALGGLRMILRTRLPEKSLNRLIRSLEMREDWQTFRAIPEEGCIAIHAEPGNCTLTAKDDGWMNILEQLQAMELITGLRMHRGKMTFSFTSEKARQLVLRPGGLEQQILARQLDGRFHRQYLMEDGSCLVMQGFRAGRLYRNGNSLWMEKMTLDWSLRPVSAGERPVPITEEDPGAAASVIMEDWKKEFCYVSTCTDEHR